MDEAPVARDHLFFRAVVAITIQEMKALQERQQKGLKNKRKKKH